MGVYSVQSIVLTGLEPSFASAADEDSFVNDGRTFLVVKNGSGSSIDVTVNSVVLCNYGFDHDLTIAVPAGEERWIGSFPVGRFNSSEGKVVVGYSSITTVTAAAVKI